MIRSRSEQRSLYGPLGPACSINLNDKDVLIGRLRAQLRASSESMQDYQRLLKQKEVMERSIEQFVAIKVLTKPMQTRLAKERDQDSIAMEKSMTSLRGQLEQLRRQLNSKTLQVNDVLSEADSLSQFCQLRHEQIQKQLLKEEELREALDTTLSERKRLEHAKQSHEEQLEHTQAQHTKIRSQNNSIQAKLVEAHSKIQDQKLRAQRLNEMLCQYEDQNNTLDEEAFALLKSEESKHADAKNAQRTIQVQSVHFSELQCRRQKLQAQISLRTDDIKLQRQRHAELQQTQKAMGQDLTALTEHLNEQNYESNFLLRRNGEIAELNNRLALDLQLCQKHLQTIRKTNEQLRDSVGRFQQQDENIIQRIQSRGATPQRKLVCSRLTNVSSSSRLQQL